MLIIKDYSDVSDLCCISAKNATTVIHGSSWREDVGVHVQLSFQLAVFMSITERYPALNPCVSSGSVQLFLYFANIHLSKFLCFYWCAVKKLHK